MLSSGLISGLNSRALVQQLVAIERQPLQAVQQRQTTLNRQVSSLGSLSSRLGELRNAVKDLSTQERMVKTSSSSSQDEAIGLRTTGNAQPTSHKVQVHHTAQSAQQRSQSFSGLNSEVQAGALTIHAWGKDPIEIEVAEGTTLGQLRDQIAASGADVTAAVVNTGDGFYLTLTNKRTGHSSGQTQGVISAADAGDPSDALVTSFVPSGAGAGQALDLTTTRAARNASLSIDGLAVQSTTNEVAGVLAGITLDVKAQTSGEADLSISVDAGETAKNIESFVQKLNATLTAVRDYGKQDQGLASRMEQELRGALRQVSGSGELRSLADLGITTDAKTGQVSLRRDLLDKALAKDPGAVAALFSESAGGLSNRLDPLLGRYTDASTGVIKGNQDALRSRVKSMDAQIERMERSLGSYEKQLVKQFNALEQSMSQLMQMGNTFASYLPALMPQSR